MNYLPIERRTALSRAEFLEMYLKPKKPVVLTDLAQQWPAMKKWTFEFLRETYGHLEVPVVGSEFHRPGPDYMKSREKMFFRDYLDLILAGPTDKRIFLWNILDHAPELTKDVTNPDICDGWVDSYPFMFFGGKGAITNLHYDIDCSNVFHTHFWTKKEIVLFDQQQNPYLYQHPFTVQSHVNPLQPDLEKFPAFAKAQGHHTILEHGETLFIPTQWWHYIVYKESGFSISLRSRDSLITQAKGVFNIARHFLVDKGMNTVIGPRWKSWKEEKARVRAEKAFEATS